jgi:hypothetical protein
VLSWELRAGPLILGVEELVGAILGSACPTLDAEEDKDGVLNEAFEEDGVDWAAGCRLLEDFPAGGLVLWLLRPISLFACRIAKTELRTILASASILAPDLVNDSVESDLRSKLGGASKVLSSRLKDAALFDGLKTPDNFGGDAWRVGEREAVGASIGDEAVGEDRRPSCEFRLFQE